MGVKNTRCPICKKPAKPQAACYPFCSDRCKTIDLGAWASEEYLVSRPLNESDELTHPSAPRENAE